MDLGALHTITGPDPSIAHQESYHSSQQQTLPGGKNMGTKAGYDS